MGVCLLSLPNTQSVFPVPCWIELISIYNAHGHKLRSPTFEKVQFVTALGIEDLRVDYENLVEIE